MKIIKINTAQIPKTEGAVIDSFDSGSDETTNAPSIRAVREKVTDIYSTNEIKTNEIWIDGKPIYRKVIEKTFTSTIGETGKAHSYDIAHGISNLSVIVKEQTRMHSSSGYKYLLPYVNGDTSIKASASVDRYDDTNIYLRIVNDTWGSKTKLTTILEYTKTTD